MMRLYSFYAIHGNQEDIELFESTVTDLADAHDVLLDGDFEDQDCDCEACYDSQLPESLASDGSVAV